MQSSQEYQHPCDDRGEQLPDPIVERRPRRASGSLLTGLKGLVQGHESDFDIPLDGAGGLGRISRSEPPVWVAFSFNAWIVTSL